MEDILIAEVTTDEQRELLAVLMQDQSKMREVNYVSYQPKRGIWVRHAGLVRAPYKKIEFNEFIKLIMPAKFIAQLAVAHNLMVTSIGYWATHPGCQIPEDWEGWE